MRLLKKGCLRYLAIVWDISIEAPSITQIPVVKEFQDAFLDELLGTLLDREIEFYIDLVLDAQLVFVPPY